MAKKVSYYRNKADRVFQIWFVAKNPYCEVCGKPTSCGHHFFPKSSATSLRYEENNMIPVCVGCHLGFHSARGSESNGIIIEKRGLDWFKELRKTKETITKVGIVYYKTIIQSII